MRGRWLRMIAVCHRVSTWRRMSVSTSGYTLVSASMAECGSVALAMSWPQALVVLFPASLYGEGLRRAFVQMTAAKDKLTGWRGRAGLLDADGRLSGLVLGARAA